MSWCRRASRREEMLDQRQQTLVSAVSAQKAAVDRIGGALYALDAAKHDAELYRVDIADDSLVAPRDGRIQYRVANVGEVLPAGGKVFTMLDTSYVYMDIYLPTLSAGRVKLGSDARIVLDAYPTRAFPAKVTFVASQAQFTPKTVETKDERDTLMFRVRVRIDPERLRAHAAEVRSGLPGMAYVRTDPSVAWPPQLQGACAEMTTGGALAARLDAVTQHYGKVVALDAVTLEIPAGCMVGLIGPDGVGKSSVLSLVAGARQIQSGTVQVLGGDMANATVPRRACARASPICRKAWAGTSIPISASARTSSFSAACSDNPIPNGRGASPSCSVPPGWRRLPTARRKNCRAACGRSSAFAARSSTIPICSSSTSLRPASTRCRAASSGN